MINHLLYKGMWVKTFNCLMKSLRAPNITYVIVCDYIFVFLEHRCADFFLYSWTFNIDHLSVIRHNMKRIMGWFAYLELYIVTFIYSWVYHWFTFAVTSPLRQAYILHHFWFLSRDSEKKLSICIQDGYQPLHILWYGSSHHNKALQVVRRLWLAVILS